MKLLILENIQPEGGLLFINMDHIVSLTTNFLTLSTGKNYKINLETHKALRDELSFQADGYLNLANLETVNKEILKQMTEEE